MMTDFDSALDRYAEVMVRIGTNLQPGQKLFVRGTRGAPELVYRVARAAYAAGASLVHVLWEDDTLDLIRVQQSPRAELDSVVDWYVRAFNGAAERGDAFLLIHAPDSELFAGVDPERAAAFQNARRSAIKNMLEAQARNEFQWSVCRVPTASWARRVFPAESAATQVEKLWDAIFAMSRVYATDPLAAWREHERDLKLRRDTLTARQYSALHFKAPGTDLTLGLAKGHIWFGGASASLNAIPFVGNVPTEEVFTMPHRDEADGYVTMTRPLSVNGVLIHNFTLRFEGGRVIAVTASNAQDVLEKLIATDEGASRLGEIALVPASNPIAQTNLVFYDGLFDENAASHFALGRAYRFTMQNGASLSESEYRAAGGNDSLIHEDTMIGSSQMDVDGICLDGTREPVMRAGEWAFAV